MTCDDRREEIVAYLDGELGPSERSALEAHLAGCPVCQRALEAERRLSSALGELSPLQPSANFEARFWARIAREQEAPSGWGPRRFTRRLALALAGAAALAAAAILALRGRVDGEGDWPIVANAQDLELLEDPDLELIEIVDLLEVLDGDQG